MLDPVTLRGLSDLTLAVEQESRQLEAFRDALLRQREAVARGDGAALEAGVRLAGRALLTLREGIRHRAAVLHRLAGDSTQPLLSIDSRFDAPLPETFLAARSGMRRLALETAEEVERNQQLLLGVLRQQDAVLQELLTGIRPANVRDPEPLRKAKDEASEG